jgi:glycyl-tRNA synthetase beta chain
MSPVAEIADSAVRRPTRSELLLELLSEEIPARMQRRAVADLTGLVRDKLAAAELPAEQLRGYVTPRRLVVVALGIPSRQPDHREERRGPRVGAPEPAVSGFLGSAGLSSIDACTIRDTERGRFYFAVLARPGRPAAAVLPELIRTAIGDLAWSKSMRWPGSPLRWVRPLRSVICLYDGAIVPVALDGVPVGRTTRGHRFLSPGEICVENATDYLAKLEQRHVIVDHERRREMIRADLGRRAADLGVSIRPDDGLLEEVAGLAEFPVVLAGAIDPGFMNLPAEVLTMAMRTHQRYFSCVYPDGSAAPRFLFVAGNLAADGGALIVAGNERVLRARLADARFFWDQDRRTRLEDRVEALKGRVYHDRLGSMYDRVERVEKLAAGIAEEVGFDRQIRGRVRRAARLAKADLSTGMVGEFPELQGIVGGYYARHDGEDGRIADAIGEHYKPLGPKDSCPAAPESVAVALADKVETLCGFFRIGEKPTGSRDPFALRRAALGIIRLILENGLRVRLRPLIHRGDNVFPPDSYGVRDLRPELLSFIIERLKAHLREQGIRHDLIAAAFVQAGESEDDLVRLLARVDALRGFLAAEDGANLLVAYRRAANIVAIEEKRDGRRYDGAIQSRLLQQPEERILALSLEEVRREVEPLLRDEQFAPSMTRLARLRRPVDEFFDKVTVNAAETELRENRLCLLAGIRDTMNRIADFSQIEG